MGISIIDEMSNLYSFIHEYDSNTSSYLVDTLTSFIKSLMIEKKGQNEIKDELIIIKSFYCIISWIMSDTTIHWLISNPNSLKILLEVIEIGLSGTRFIPELKQETLRKTNKPGESSNDLKVPLTVEAKKKELAKSPSAPKVVYYYPTEKIREAANYAYINIANRIDSFPNPCGPSNLSSLQTEVDILSSLELSSEYLSCFIYNRTLLSIIRNPRIKGGSTNVTFILRDETGRYVWNSQLVYNQIKFTEPPNEDLELEPIIPLEVDPVDENLLNSLSSFLGPKDKNIQNAFLKASSDLLLNEKKLLESKNYGRAVDIKLNRTEEDVKDDKLDSTNSRLFLSCLGINSIENYDELFTVQRFNDPQSRFNYLQNFANLDKTKE
jgi:hypothetical protein